LSPKALDQFLDDFWDYYRDLLAYKDAPSQQMAEKLRFEFWKLFDTPSGYQQLDERKQLTLLKISELLLVLEHPELPWHNNLAELYHFSLFAATTNAGLASIRAWMSVMDLEIWY
jgi:hypothetical protein